MKLTRQLLVVYGLCLLAVAGFGLKWIFNGETRSRRLANGGRMRIKQVSVYATNHIYHYKSQLYRDLIAITPLWARNHFNLNLGGATVVDSTGNTNLWLVTEFTHGSSNRVFSPDLLFTSDEEVIGIANPSLGSRIYPDFAPGMVTVGREISVFPRRGRYLNFRFVSPNHDEIADLRIKNPLYAEYPQWVPATLPATKTNQHLAITLQEFQTATTTAEKLAQVAGGGRAQNPVATRLKFSFAENGKPTEDFRIKDLAITDATDNYIHPRLPLIQQHWNWASNGTVYFLGNLWPGEQAWKVRAVIIRQANLPVEDQWTFSLELPKSGFVDGFADIPEWKHANATVQLKVMGSPKAFHSGLFGGLGYWWLDSRGDEVYSVGLKITKASKDWTATLLRGVDQDGEPVELVGQSETLPTGEFVLFVRPQTKATKVHLTLSLQRSHIVEFLARPEFVNTVTNSVR